MCFDLVSPLNCLHFKLSKILPHARGIILRMMLVQSLIRSSLTPSLTSCVAFSRLFVPHNLLHRQNDCHSVLATASWPSAIVLKSQVWLRQPWLRQLFTLLRKAASRLALYRSAIVGIRPASSHIPVTSSPPYSFQRTPPMSPRISFNVHHSVDNSFLVISFILHVAFVHSSCQVLFIP